MDQDWLQSAEEITEEVRRGLHLLAKASCGRDTKLPPHTLEVLRRALRMYTADKIDLRVSSGEETSFDAQGILQQVETSLKVSPDGADDTLSGSPSVKEGEHLPNTRARLREERRLEESGFGVMTTPNKRLR